MHHRQRIRDAVAARLLAANTLAAANVFTSRARPILEILQKREAVLSIYTADESSERSPDAHLMVRTLTVSIEGMAGGGDNLDDVLDTFAEQVEAAVANDPTLGNLLTREMVLTSTASEISARGNQQVGAFRLDYECTYVTELKVPSDDLLWPEMEIPSTVIVNPVPTPEAYRPTLERPDSAPVESAQSVACADGSCSIPAYGGDLSDDKLVQPL